MSVKQAVRTMLTPIARVIRKEVLPRFFPAPAHRWPDPLHRVRVVGLLSSASGLGKSARLCAEVLDRAGYEVSGADMAALYRSDDGIEPGVPVGGPGGAQVSIYHLNPPMLLPGILRTNPVPFWRGYNIGYWAWELEVLPREWVQAIGLVDAIIVPSSFCRKAVEQHTDKPVIVVPHPVGLGGNPAGRSEAPASDRPFRVVSVFNFGSSFERKNPLASIAAFRLAFGEDTSAELVLKVGDGDRYPADRARLTEAIGASRNIRLVDEIWDERRVVDLIGSAGAYLSLHRSEGFGLTLAEAIAAGVPVVATHWSGNTDFCSPDLCFPVDFTLIPVRDGHLSFKGIGAAVWADPSAETAAAHLRTIRGDISAAQARAARLKAHLRAYLDAATYPDAFARLASGTASREKSLGNQPRDAWAGP